MTVWNDLTLFVTIIVPLLIVAGLVYTITGIAANVVERREDAWSEDEHER